MLASLALLVALAPPLPGYAKGIQDGWVVNDDLSVRLSPEIATTMRESGATWVRVHFRLSATQSTFNDEYLARFEQAVNNAEDAGLQVLGLFTYESWPGGQAAWTANSAEIHGGNGDNTYIQDWAKEFGRIARRFPSIRYWELWNEPNCWTQNPPGDPINLPGQFYAYPSNFAWMLRRGFEAVADLPDRPAIIAGGLLIGQFSEDLGHNLGTDYLEHVYQMGETHAGWAEFRAHHGQNPMDAWAAHFYVLGGGNFEPSEFATWTDLWADALRTIDPTQRQRPIWVTEIGWQTLPGSVSETAQAKAIGSALAALRNDGRYGPVIYFKLHDEPGLVYGLRRADGTPKESWTTFQTAP